jgi:hypothetical protein
MKTTKIHYFLVGFSTDNIYVTFNGLELPDCIELGNNTFCYGDQVIRIEHEKKIKRLIKKTDLVYAIEYAPVDIKVGDVLPNSEIVETIGEQDKYGVVYINGHYGLINKI